LSGDLIGMPFEREGVVDTVAGAEGAVRPQDFRAKRDNKLANLTAWIASFVRVPCR
jgi:hypothetical protein